MTYLAAYGYYFWTIGGVAATGPGAASMFPFGRLLINVMCLLVIVEMVLQVSLSLWTPKEAQAPQDEREKLVALKSTRAAFYVVMASAATGAGAAALGTPPFYSANLIFLGIVLAEVVRFLSQVIQFRMDA